MCIYVSLDNGRIACAIVSGQIANAKVEEREREREREWTGGKKGENEGKIEGETVSSGDLRQPRKFN